MTFVDRLPSTFTTQELQRLDAYRAAVAAGFYTDWPEGTPSSEADPPQPEDEAEPPVQPAKGGGATSDLSAR